MSRAKSDIKRSYPPQYVGKASLAYLLDMSETKINQAIASGQLPSSVMVLGVERWNFVDIRSWIDSGAEGAEDLDNNEDPFMVALIDRS